MAKKPPPGPEQWTTTVVFPDVRLLVAVDAYARSIGTLRNEAILKLLDRALREAGIEAMGTSGGPNARPEG